MEKVCFVILHFMVLRDTVECVNSIKNNLKNDNISIVIVDNASTNNSGEELQKIYKNCENIHVILNEKNMGFAQGNNVGYRFARNTLGAEYIICINNDTLIEQKDFVDKIISIFNDTQYYILGPDIVSIYSSNHYHQNPARINGFTKNDVEELLVEYRKKYIKTYLKYITHSQKLITAIKRNIFKIDTEKYNNANMEQSNDLYMKSMTNVQLHGACLIFSPLYVKVRENAFCPDTYMYLEEDILFFECKKNNYKTLYDPAVRILHKEDASTDAIIRSSLEKTLFIVKHSKKSALILFKMMENQEQ